MLIIFLLLMLKHSLPRSQEDFFGELQKKLAKMPEVQELHPIPDAYVPVMKFKFDGVSIDLLYANVALMVIPEV